MSECNCSECLVIVVKFSYNYDNFNIKKENNMSVNESQIKNTTAGAIDDDDAVIFKERKRLLFLGLPWTFTKYTVTPSFITVESGLLSTTEDDCYMYKVADVKLTTSLMERIFNLGTIVCYTGDVTNPELKLVHVKHSREIKNYLLKQSEAARLKRRTLNTVDIGAHGADMADLDHDGIPDSME